MDDIYYFAKVANENAQKHRELKSVDSEPIQVNNHKKFNLKGFASEMGCAIALAGFMYILYCAAWVYSFLW